MTDLAAIGREIAHEQIESARAVERAAAPRVSPRLQRALERAEEKRRLAAERRATVLAQRSADAARKQASGAADDADSAPVPSAGRRARGASAPLSPPPLFVHKRTRDGSIQKLERPATESATPPPA